jgi:hypothetical protein
VKVRGPLIGGVASAVVIALSIGPASASGAESCEGTACGVPKCWDSSVRLRPDMTRRVRFSCWDTTSARLVTPPAHSDVSNVSTDWSGVSFDARPHDGAPRYDEAVFEVSGHEGSVEERVRIEVVPRSENSAPVCYGDRISQRTDGTGPVDLFMHPSCYDPDDDEFVMEGGPPGVHRDSPKSVPAGESESNWYYRTATAAGEEVTTVWATDSLGARSPDARLEITVGPGVDSLPTCTPGSYTAASVIAVRSRPGATRRFGIRCEDSDADPFTAQVSSPPERGTLSIVDPIGPRSGWWGVERWYDATYVPPDDSLESDPFTITASGERGDGPAGRMAMVPRELPENHGGGCGWSPADVLNPGAGVLTVSCIDDEGDPLSAEIITEPRHGQAGPAVLTPGLYGYEDITVPYVPEPGHEGYDCVEVRITDGHGLVFKIAIDIWVRPAPPEPPDLPDPPPLPEVPPLPEAPTLPPIPPATTGPAPPEAAGTRAEPVRSVVERILGTQNVKRVRNGGGAQVWARSKLSRRDALRTGEAPSVVVVCSARCQIKGDSALAPRAKALRSSRRKSLAAVMPGQPHVLSLTLGGAERRALRRSRRPRATFRLRIRADGAAPTALRHSIPFTR